MDSGFKNDQLRRLNLKLGQPQYPHRDDYEQDTVFDYLYEINKAVQQYMKILTEINNNVIAMQSDVSDINAYTQIVNGKIDTLSKEIVAVNTSISGEQGTNSRLTNMYNLIDSYVTGNNTIKPILNTISSSLTTIANCVGTYAVDGGSVVALRVLNSSGFWG